MYVQLKGPHITTVEKRRVGHFSDEGALFRVLASFQAASIRLSLKKDEIRTTVHTRVRPSTEVEGAWAISLEKRRSNLSRERENNLLNYVS